jgi:peptidyl-prolyl cis-trans isomerase B (cyclophilin B)
MLLNALCAVLLACVPQDKADLTVGLTLDRAELPVGEELQAEVVLTNAGAADASVAELVLEERSLSFEVSFDAGGKPRSFTFSEVKPDPQVVGRVGPARVTLKPKKSVTALFRIPALRAGTITVTAIYKGGPQEVKSAPATAKASPVGDANRLAAQVETSMGSFQIDLLPEEAPNSVAHFVLLARRGFFDGLNVHRVVRNGWIQTGCPYDNGFGGPGYALRSEAETQTLTHEAGSVALAGNLKTGYTGSQFFVNLTRNLSFDKKFTVFGKVSGAGLDVAKKIGAADADKATDRPVKDIKVTSIKIVAVK